MFERQHGDSDGSGPKVAGESQNPGAGRGLPDHEVLRKVTARRGQSKKILSEIQPSHLKNGNDDEKISWGHARVIKRSDDKCLSNTYDLLAGIFQTTSHYPLIRSEN